jgi:hypothetical protein
VSKNGGAKFDTINIYSFIALTQSLKAMDGKRRIKKEQVWPDGRLAAQPSILL